MKREGGRGEGETSCREVHTHTFVHGCKLVHPTRIVHDFCRKKISLFEREQEKKNEIVSIPAESTGEDQYDDWFTFSFRCLSHPVDGRETNVSEAKQKDERSLKRGKSEEKNEML